MLWNIIIAGNDLFYVSYMFVLFFKFSYLVALQKYMQKLFNP